MKQVVVGIISRTNNNQKEYLLMSSKNDFGKYTGFFYPPGGHLEEGEDEEEALIREIKEELGIEVTPISKVTESPGDVADQNTRWWLCEASNLNIKLQKEEVANIGWFTKEAIVNSNQVWPATKSFFKKF